MKNFTGPANPGDILTANGKIYGIAGPQGHFSDGTLFQLSTAGESIFFNFTFNFPGGNLLRDAGGNVYGSAGTTDETGILYKVDAGGNLTTSHSFGGFPVDGDDATRLVSDGHGSLYGMTSGGGSTGAGTIFKLTP